MHNHLAISLHITAIAANNILFMIFFIIITVLSVQAAQNCTACKVFNESVSAACAAAACAAAGLACSDQFIIVAFHDLAKMDFS